MVKAAWADPLHGYGCDGDAHWSLRAIRTWWAEERREVEASLVRERAAQLALGSAKDYAYFAGLERWLEYVRHELQPYLQMSAVFVEEGHLPDSSAVLPTL